MTQWGTRPSGREERENFQYDTGNTKFSSMTLEIQNFPVRHWKLRKSQEEQEKKVTSKTACDAHGQ